MILERLLTYLDKQPCCEQDSVYDNHELMGVGAVFGHRNICGGFVGVRLHRILMLSLFISFVNTMRNSFDDSL